MTRALLEDHAAAPPPLWAGPTRFRSAREVAVMIFLLGCATVTVLTTAGIVGILGFESVHFFQESKISPVEVLTTSQIDLEATPPRFGILPLIWGTIVVALGASVIALPIGLLSAIYLSEYAPRRLRTVIKPSLELLAGIPSIVYGYLALVLVTPGLQAVFLPMGLQVDAYNVLSACVVVGIMVIPMVSSLSEDVLSAVPRGLREAGYGLGATKFEVSTRIVLPAGLSGVAASFILAISRAIGETMAVALAAGFKPQISLNPLKSNETMTVYISTVVNPESGSPIEYLSLFAVGAALFLLTLGLNIISGLVLRRYREDYR